MRINWISSTLRAISNSSWFHNSRPLRLRNRRSWRPSHVELLEDRALLAASDLVGGLLNLPPIGTSDIYNVPQDQTYNAAISVLANDSDPESITLNAVLVTGPLHGDINLLSDGLFSYTPDAGFTGADTFVYLPNDGTLSGLLPIVNTINVLPIINPPVAHDDSFTVQEDALLETSIGTLLDGVLENDEGLALTASLITTTSHGSLVFLPTGTFVYTPTHDFTGTDSFTYKASDLLNSSNIATVMITVTAVNDAPVAANDSYSTAVGKPLVVTTANGVLANDTDVDNTNLTAVVASNPSHGTVTLNANGSFTYTPTAGYAGPDSFTYRANDGALNSNVATVSISVAGSSNTAPVAVNNSYNVTEDTPLTVNAANGVLTNDTDANGDPLTAVIVSQPAHGTVALASNGSFVYTPAVNYSGPDSFTYRAADGVSQSNVATVSLTVAAVNDAPKVVNDSYSTAANTALTVNAVNGVLKNDSDVEGSSLTVAAVAQPANGTLTLNANGSFTYTPDAGFSGTDTFTYRANDGTANSAVATVSITVSAPSNSPPVAVNDTYTLAEDGSLTTTVANGVLKNDTDANSNPLTAKIVTQPAHGTVVLSANGSFVYTPAVNYSGTDSFTYQANDGVANSNVATVALTITGANDAPVANNDSYATSKGVTLTVNAANGVLADDTDPDSANLTVAVVATTTNGTLTLNSNGSFTYVPNAGFAGSDSFTYRANDGTLNSNTATVTINVTGTANASPVAVNNSYNLTEGTTFVAQVANGVLANDTDSNGDPLTAVLVTQPSHGTLVLASNGSFVYSPDSNYSGPDSFTYRASDGVSQSNVATVNLNIAAVNDAPEATNDSYFTSGGSLTVAAAQGVLGNDSDVDSANLTAALVSQPANGSVTLNPNGSFTYTPQTGFVGLDVFTYRASDGSLNSNLASVAITVTAPTNSAPEATNDSYTLVEETTLTRTAANGVLSNDTDADGNPLTASLVSQANHGTVTLQANGSFTYTPDANFSGQDTFAYQVSDGIANSNVAIVTLTVTGVNDAPVSVTDSYTVTAGQLLTISAANGVLANDSDADSPSLTAAVVNPPQNGTLTLNANGSFSYTPNVGFTGVDVFTYRATDGALNSTPSQVSITVLGAPNTAPVAGNDSYQVTEDTALTRTALNGVLSNDTDVDGNPLTVHLISDPAHGTVTLAANGSFTYTPDANYSGTDSFTYQANDGSANSGVATVTLTIAAVNDAPVTAADNFNTPAGTTLTLSAAAGVLANDTDTDGNALTAVLVAQPQHGTLTLNASGSLTYVPSANFSGTDTFTYRANDGTTNGNVATVTITVNGGETNGAPVVTTSNGKQTVKGRKRIVIDPAVNVTDANSPTFNGGSMTVTIQSGVGSKDMLSYRHGGANRGRVNSKQNQLRVGRVVIGTLSGGLHGSPLHVEFNSNATLERVKNVMQNLTFRGTNGSAGPRVIAFQVKDDTGLLSNIATKGIDQV